MRPYPCHASRHACPHRVVWEVELTRGLAPLGACGQLSQSRFDRSPTDVLRPIRHFVTDRTNRRKSTVRTADTRSEFICRKHKNLSRYLYNLVTDTSLFDNYKKVV
jgi:hypothetical protein